ncbi:MAG: T9SS type A sorting domain-containing protein [bacterium]|nr:T9SS type A sorting domain-containing protein [bacterium]
MKRTLSLVLAISLLFSVGIAFAQSYDYLHTQVTRWADPTRQPLSYQDYLLLNPPKPFESKLIGRWAGVADDPLPFVIVVNTTLYPQITMAVNQYIADLTAENYQAILYTSQGGTPTSLKTDILQYEWNRGAVGVMLIGDLPVPWFELYEDFDNNNIPDAPDMVSFPCDLFYMDLNGEFRDDDGDGLYDYHGGSWQPDFWVGRLTASTLQGTQSTLINSYFARNHSYRHGGLWLPNRALAYIDDDWSQGAPSWANAVEMVWPTTTLVSQPNSTTAADYMARWDDNYQHVLLASHSSPVLHQLKENNGQSWGTVYYNQIAAGDPHFLFYNLFACSNCRFVEQNYCGGVYLFNEPYAVNVIGSTKTGSMLYFEDYYGPLSGGQTFGAAFNYWMTIHANQPMAVMWARSWFYGMSNLGDPTLVTGLSPAPIDVTLTPANPPITIPASGGSFSYTIQLSNVDAASHQTTAWCDITLPDSSVQGPVLGPRTLTMGAGSNLSRSRTMTISASSPPGLYHLNGYALVDQDYSHDSFTFVKLGTGSAEGVFQYLSSGEEFGEAVAAATPASFISLDNYPNPFNPTTTIRYELPIAGLVRLSVYDISGRQVVDLVDGMREAGSQEVTFDGSNLASGVYLYRLKVGDQVAQDKMMLLK